MDDIIVHLSPSNLNSWEELRTATEDSPPWVTPDEFKKSILGEYKSSLSAEAGNAVHGFVFENRKSHEAKEFRFTVDEDFMQFRKYFPFGYGVPEVSKVKYFPDKIEGCRIRISQRADYLSRNIVTEMKTSSHSFIKKGVLKGYLESPQSFSYTWTWEIPIRFLFAEIVIDKKHEPMRISLKRADHSTAYPSSDSVDRLYNCVKTLVPYLREDPEMWKRVTNRKLQDEF